MEQGIYEKYNGNDREVSVSVNSAGARVVTIGTKAFLSCRTIRRLTLPDSLESVQDWGFAHMKSLEEISFPAKAIHFGRKVFLGCDRLAKVIPQCDFEIYEGTPYFLADSVQMAETRLLTFDYFRDSAGEKAWLEAFDELLLQYMSGPDDAGYEPGFVGWFNVEDVDDVRIAFMRERKKQKIRFLFRRLVWDKYLSAEHYEKIRSYILGEVDEELPELFVALLKTPTESFSREPENLRIWFELGGEKVLPAGKLLEELACVDPEMRAFLMQKKLSDDGGGGDDFFAGFDL